MSRAAGAPDWYKDAIFYEVHVKAFMDGNGDGIGDFAGLTARLDYLQELGVDCLWLLPMYASPLRDDGYDIADFYTFIPPTERWPSSGPSSMPPTRAAYGSSPIWS